MNGIRMTLVSAMRMSSLSQESRGLSGSGTRGCIPPPAAACLQCSAVLHAPPGLLCCSQVVGLGPIPPGPVSAQASSSSYPTLLQHVKVALRAQAQPPPVTSTLRRFSPDSKGRGKSQKYKPEFSLEKMKLNFSH